jgi:hypothetical protein
MTKIVGVRGLFAGAKKVSVGTSSSLCCDHCRAKLEFCTHHYWRMRFCSAACMSAYQQRLSAQTHQKIQAIGGQRPAWKAAS